MKSDIIKILSLEENKELVDGKVELAIDEVRRADFIEAGVKGTRDGYASKFSTLEEILETVGEISDGIDNGQNVYNEFIKEKKPPLEKLKLTEEKFLFPVGDKSDVRRIQLQALKYADVCYSTRGTVSDSIAALDTQFDDIKNDDALNSAIIVKGSVALATAERAISNIESALSGKNSVKDLIQSRSNGLNDLAQQLHSCGRVVCKYELATEIKRELNSNGVESIIVNRNVEKVLESQKIKEEKKIRDMADSYLSGFKRIIHESTKEYKHKLIWGTAAALMAVLWIIGVATGFNFVMVALGNTLPLVYSASFYIAIAVSNNLKTKRNKQREILRDKTAKYIENEKIPQIIEEFNKQYDIIEMCRIIDDEIISEYYEKTCELIKCGEELRAKMFEFLCRLNKDIEEINYLPSGVNLDHISKIIEFMEQGVAEDYRAAALQAVQHEVTNACNAAQIAIMKAMETQRRNEARAQKEMQEYYERQRLAETRAAAARQAESARRAEQYAKEQAESAKRAADAQKETARYAEKQAEAAEELLRRSNDPYYINRWKKGE